MSAGTCYAQVSSTVALSNGVELRVTTNPGQPTGEENLKIEMARASGNSFYRIFRDQNNLAVFAYELAVDRAANGNEIRITAKPAETAFAARFPNADGGKPVPTLSAERDLRPLRSGERAEIGLFELAGMGLKVIDTIEVRLNQGGASAGPGVRLRFAGLKVYINHAIASGPGPRGLVSGRYAMFYIPGRGGYFFSTDAPPGRPFVKAGTIDHNRMQFTVDNDDYECVADSPILLNSDNGEVWVYHDPSYRPAGNWTNDTNQTGSDEFFTAASDSLSWWLP